MSLIEHIVELDEELSEYRLAKQVYHRHYHLVESCGNCKGTGFTYRRRMTGSTYDTMDDYELVRENCRYCNGEGRVVTTTTTIEIKQPSEEYKTSVPFSEFTGDLDEEHSSQRFLNIDRRDYSLEKKYPELEKLSYRHYNEAVKQYEALEALKK